MLGLAEWLVLGLIGVVLLWRFWPRIGSAVARRR